jgi:AcrR family transcriptional regulator
MTYAQPSMTEAARVPRSSYSAGRPTRDQASALADRIVEAAACLIAQNGYQATSVEAIARAAGVAKRTVYSRFDGKPQLLAAVLRLLVSRLTPPLTMGLAHLNLRTRLETLGRHLLHYCLTEEAVTWTRLISSELARVPELADTVQQETVEVVDRYTRNLLQAAIDAGELPPIDLAFAARTYSQLMIAPARELAATGASPGTTAEQDRYIAQAVDFFLRGCGAAP